MTKFDYQCCWELTKALLALGTALYIQFNFEDVSNRVISFIMQSVSLIF